MNTETTNTPPNTGTQEQQMEQKIISDSTKGAAAPGTDVTNTDLTTGTGNAPT